MTWEYKTWSEPAGSIMTTDGRILNVLSLHQQKIRWIPNWIKNHVTGVWGVDHTDSEPREMNDDCQS